LVGKRASGVQLCQPSDAPRPIVSVFSAVRHNGTARFSWARTLMKRPLTDKSIVDQRAKRARGYLFAVETLNGARPIISLRAILAHHQSAKAVRLSVSFFLC